MDCEQFREALIEREPGPAERDHAEGCAGCARLLLVTLPSSVPIVLSAIHLVQGEPAGMEVSARRERTRRVPLLAAIAAGLLLGALGVRAALDPDPTVETTTPQSDVVAAVAVPRASIADDLLGDGLDDAFDDPAVDDLFDSPTDILSTAVLYRSQP